MEASQFSHFWSGIFCWTSAQHLTHTHANDHRWQYFPPHFAHTWETWTCTEGAENQVYATAASAVGSCPSANTQRQGEEGLQAARCSRRGSMLTAKPHVWQPPAPGLSCPCAAGVVLCGHYPRTESKGAQGDLDSSAWGQAELSLTPLLLSSLSQPAN